MFAIPLWPPALTTLRIFRNPILIEEKAPRQSLKEATVAKTFQKIAFIALIAFIASIAIAQNNPNDVRPSGPLQAQMGIDQHYGAQVPLDATFKDETGRTVKFGDMLQGKPVILLPMFFGCN